jgi:prolyl-tRNA synthetase
MVHGDDKGLVLPPRVSGTQVIIIPVGITVNTTNETKSLISDTCKMVENELKKSGVRVIVDDRGNYTPGWKFNHYEVKGVPVRMEIGPKDIEKGQVRIVRRDNSDKFQMEMYNQGKDISGFGSRMNQLLDTIQTDMFNKAEKSLKDRIKYVTKWQDFTTELNKKNLLMIPWCEEVACEESIKEKSAVSDSMDEPQDEKAPSMGAKSLCIPLEQPADRPITSETKCTSCGKPAKRWTLFGRSY